MGTAFGRRCIPPGGVGPPSNKPGIIGRRALPVGRRARGEGLEKDEDADGKGPVGSSTEIFEASRLALSDALEFVLLVAAAPA